MHVFKDRYLRNVCLCEPLVAWHTCEKSVVKNRETLKT